MQDCNHLRSFMFRQKKKAMGDEGEKGDEERVKTSTEKRYIRRSKKKRGGKNGERRK